MLFITLIIYTLYIHMYIQYISRNILSTYYHSLSYRVSLMNYGESTKLTLEEKTSLDYPSLTILLSLT